MRNNLPPQIVPDHAGLAYTCWAPTDKNGKLKDDLRPEYLQAISAQSVSPDYIHSYKRWRESHSESQSLLFELTLSSRLLIGHGNSSATDIGLTLHHTWGVPMIPGSAIKGLLASYVETTLGPSPSDLLSEEEPLRATFQGVRWSGTRIQHGPGALYRALFGAPDALEDEHDRARGLPAGAMAGCLSFHDALYIPDGKTGANPLAVDVLTVHQKPYYDTEGQQDPNDYTSPNPVSFITVKPKSRFLFALSGPEDWTALAAELLKEALSDWGIGGKTSAGYGRFRDGSPDPKLASPPPSKSAAPIIPSAGTRITVTLLAERTKKGGWRAQNQALGLEGPIVNSHEVPPDKSPGEEISVVINTAKGEESSFKVVAETEPPLSKSTKKVTPRK